MPPSPEVKVSEVSAVSEVSEVSTMSEVSEVSEVSVSTTPSPFPTSSVVTRQNRLVSSINP